MIQSNIFDAVQTTNRKPSQATRVLRYLQARGRYGVKNHEFVDQNILRYGARITELRQNGYHIKAQYKGNGVYLYTLIDEAVSDDTH